MRRRAGCGLRQRSPSRWRRFARSQSGPGDKMRREASEGRSLRWWRNFDCGVSQDYGYYSSAFLLPVIQCGPARLASKSSLKEFEIILACAFIVETERCFPGLVAISAISFFTMARPNEL